jgi:hypothetical protein
MANGGTNAFAFSITSPVRDGNWHNIVVVWDGTTTTNSARTYVDGILKGSATPTATASTVGVWTTEVLLGTFISSGYYNGSMDNARFFNKALTPMEVAALYTETTPMEEPLVALVDPFKDGSGKALYRLEGNALDESGNYNGTATSVTYGNGISGRALGFSTTTGNVTTAYPVLTYANSWAVNIWTKWDGTGTTYFAPFLSGDLSILYSVGDAAIFIVLCNGTITSALILKLNATQDVTNYNKLKDGTWHMLTVSHTGGSTNLSYSVDGAIGANLTHGNGGWLRSSDTRFGYYSSTYAANTAGFIDQVRIFNRALTADEVTTIYQAGA